MIGTFLAGIGGKILMGVMAAGLLTGAYFYWQHVVTSRALLEIQRDQLAAALKAKDEAIADRNRIWAQVSSLPEVRLRLCAQRPIADGCCKPEGECKP